MTEEELIAVTAKAMVRDRDARAAYNLARAEADAASDALRDSWTALRDFQDKQVTAAALRLVA